MKVNVLKAKQMRDIGFTDYFTPNWYFGKRICEKYPVTIIFSINKKTKNCKIDILDENFLQPYPYEKDKEIYNNAQKWVDYMIECGIFSKEGKYI